MKTEEEPERSQIDRCLAALEDALARCRTEDVRFGMGIAVPLSFLELHADKNGHSSNSAKRWRISARMN
jgi:hypothetical protein